MSFNFVKFLTKFSSTIREIVKINSKYKSYFDSLRKHGVRDLDWYFLNSLVKKKEIKPYPSEFQIEKYTQEKKTIEIRDETLWENRNFEYVTEGLEVELNPNTDNQHLDFHSQRIILLEKLLKKRFKAKTITELKEDENLRLAFVSPATETSHRLWGRNCHINCFLSNDINDIKRATNYLNQLIALTPENQMDLVFTNLCTCKQDDKMCEHIEQFEPTAVVFPHSIYYMKDTLINNILDSGADVLFTAHIFQSGTEDIIASNGRKIISWSCYMNTVRFNVLDDKKYEHKSFMPVLMNEKNVVTKNSLTKLEYWFEYDCMLHGAGYISSDPFRKADFSSGSVISEKSKYILGTRHCLRAVNDRDVGSVYVKEDKDEKFMVKVLNNTVQCFNFRADNFKFYDLFFGGKAGNFKDDEYTDLSSRFSIEYPESCVEITNEIYNHLFTVAFNQDPKQLDHDKLKKLFAQTEQLIGNSSNNHYMNYVVLKNILYDVLLANIMVDDLSKSKIVKLLNKFPIQENLLDKIANFFLGDTKLDKNLAVIEDPKQTYEEPRLIPKQNIIQQQIESKVVDNLIAAKEEINKQYKEILQVFEETWHKPHKNKNDEIISVVNSQEQIDKRRDKIKKVLSEEERKSNDNNKLDCSKINDKGPIESPNTLTIRYKIMNNQNKKQLQKMDEILKKKKPPERIKDKEKGHADGKQNKKSQNDS